MQSLSDELLARLDLGATLIVPSHQRAEAVRLAVAGAMLARGQRVWPTPDVLTPDAWTARAVERSARDDPTLPRVLGAAEHWWLFREAARETADALSLPALASLSGELERAWRLSFDYRIAPDPTPGAPVEARALVESVRRVRRRWSELGAEPAVVIAERIAALDPARELVVADVAVPSPRWRALLARRAEAGSPIRTVPPPGAHSGAGAHFDRVVSAADELQELDRIADWCRSTLRRDPRARLLIVLPGDPARRERLATLIRQAVDPRSWLDAPAADADGIAAVEGGRPLVRWPLAQQAFDALAALTRPQRFETWSATLRAPGWRSPDALARGTVDALIRRRVPRVVPNPVTTLRSAAGACPDDVAVLVRAFEGASAALGTGSAAPRVWSERLRTALTALGWPGPGAADPVQAQLVARVLELLDELGSLSALGLHWTAGEAVDVLRARADRVAFGPATGDSPVTITGSFASPVVRYDGLWVGALTSETLPASVAADPFLPPAAQRAARVPGASAADRVDEAWRVVSAWRAAATELVGSAPMQRDDVPVSRSSFLAARAPPATGGPIATDVWAPIALVRPAGLEPYDDARGLEWPAGLPLPGGSRALALQNDCPFRAYAELRLGCTAPEHGVAGVGADERGRLLHRVLERTWRELGTSAALASRDGHELAAWLLALCEDTAGELAGTSASQPAWRREVRRTARVAARLLETERTRPPFRVVATEQSLATSIGGWPLRLRIDRIDEIADEGLAILDYKSGEAAPAEWFVEAPSNGQLLAYLGAVDGPVVALAAVHVAARRIRVVGAGARAGLLPQLQTPPDATEWTAWIGRWRARAAALATQFGQGEAPVAPRPRSCETCHLALACRIGELGGPDGEGDEQDTDAHGEGADA